MAIDSSQCARIYAEKEDKNFNAFIQQGNILNDGIICTLTEDKRGFCIGDSGSPLVSLVDGTLVGIVSWYGKIYVLQHNFSFICDKLSLIT